MMISILKRHANKLATVLIGLNEVKLLSTDFGTGMKAISPTVLMLDGKKYYVELIAEQKFPYTPSNILEGFEESEMMEFFGIKLLEIIDDGVVPNTIMHGEIFNLSTFINEITDDNLKIGINNKIVELQEDSVMEEEHLAKINEMWLSRGTGSKTLAREFIYN